VRRPVAHGLARDGGRGEAGNERGREEHHDNGLRAGQGDSGREGCEQGQRSERQHMPELELPKAVSITLAQGSTMLS